MSRTFGEIIDDYMKLNDELEHKVFQEVICSERVAVVRCKNCKHRYMDGEVTHYYWCRLHDRPVDDTDYCAWGEESEVAE